MTSQRLFPDGKQDGLYLRVQNGVKSWVVRYRAGPVQRQKSLPLSQPYAQARDLARELRLAARRGTDLVADARAEMDAKRQKELSERTRDRRMLGKVIEGYLAGPVLRLEPWVVHDLRRSFCTHCAELGIAPHIIEAVVNHISGHKGGVAGIYNRAQYAQEKRAALQRWADHVESIMAGEPDGDNVVTFAR